VGKGRVIPLTFLPIQAIRQINLLSEQLSYSAIPTTPIGPHRAGHVPA
jgi:hypothetical protein